MRSPLVASIIFAAAVFAACGGGSGSDDTELVSSRSVPTATLPAQLPKPLIINSADLPASAAGRQTHTVQAGDTPGAIAQAYGVGLTELLEANGLGAGAVLRIGQKLIIPAPDTLTGPPARQTRTPIPTPTPTPTPSGGSPGASPTPASRKVYVVKQGDIASAIADEHGITVAQLATANGLTVQQLDRLLVGQQLIIP